MGRRNASRAFTMYFKRLDEAYYTPRSSPCQTIPAGLVPRAGIGSNSSRVDEKGIPRA